MTLKLTRPLVWLDVETHDKVPPEKAYICELGFEMWYPDGKRKVWESFVKPPVLISGGATGVHNITNAMVADAPPFSHFARSLAHGFTNCDFGGYHVKFDLRCLKAEMDRAGVSWTWETAYLVDPLRMWQVARPRTLGDAVREHCSREPSDAHRALADAQDARDVGMAMLERYELPKTVKELYDLCFTNPDHVDAEGRIIWVGDVACIGFGKWNGTPLAKVDLSYLKWILKSDFPQGTKRIIEAAINGSYPSKE